MKMFLDKYNECILFLYSRKALRKTMLIYYFEKKKTKQKTKTKQNKQKKNNVITFALIQWL